MPFHYSTDGERFDSEPFATREGAIAEAAASLSEGDIFQVGERESPTPPENWWNTEDWLETVSCQDEYSGDFADDWDESTPAQREELELEVRAAMARWLDKYKLRPKFWLVVKVEDYRIVDGKAVLVSPPGAATS